MNLKIAALALGLGVLAGGQASAAVAPGPSHLAKASMVVKSSALGTVAAAGDKLASSQVEKARWRGRRHYRRYRGGGRWIAPAIIGGLIIGSTIAQSQAGYRDRWEMCADRYQSFSWADGTFQPYDGPRRICPYLVR